LHPRTDKEEDITTYGTTGIALIFTGTLSRSPRQEERNEYKAGFRSQFAMMANHKQKELAAISIGLLLYEAGTGAAS
jgi:hypothetical protein